MKMTVNCIVWILVMMHAMRQADVIGIALAVCGFLIMMHFIEEIEYFEEQDDRDRKIKRAPYVD